MIQTSMLVGVGLDTQPFCEQVLQVLASISAPELIVVALDRCELQI